MRGHLVLPTGPGVHQTNNAGNRQFTNKHAHPHNACKSLGKRARFSKNKRTPFKESKEHDICHRGIKTHQDDNRLGIAPNKRAVHSKDQPTTQALCTQLHWRLVLTVSWQTIQGQDNGVSREIDSGLGRQQFQAFSFITGSLASQHRIIDISNDVRSILIKPQDKLKPKQWEWELKVRSQWQSNRRTTRRSNHVTLLERR
jgi:hypothetical protein